MSEPDSEVKEVYSKASETSYDLVIKPRVINDTIEFSLFRYDCLENRKINYCEDLGFFNISMFDFDIFVKNLEQDNPKVILALTKKS